MKQEPECLRTEILALLDRDAITKEDTTENSTFSGLLHNFVGITFTEAEAVNHWKHILIHAKEMTCQLHRTIGIHTAVVDYFTTIKPLMDAPFLVEKLEFRQTEQLAMIDGLTGIFNRRYMDIILKKEFNRCSRYNKPLSVCLIDLDNFKNINDTQGHAFGDLALKQIADALKGALREEDNVCRYGGEEFLLILPETDSAGAEILANRIRMNLKKTAFFSDNNITFSAGIATFPESNRELTDLLKGADMALYQAKFNGKDRVIIAPKERRKFDRHTQTWKVDIYQTESPQPLSGVSTLNVSVGGVQFDSPVKFSLDAPLHLVFTNSDSSIPLVETDGRITWVKKKNSNFLYGVNFAEAPEIIESCLNLTADPQPTERS